MRYLSKDFFSTEFGRKASDIISRTSDMLISGDYSNIPVDNVPPDVTASWGSVLDSYLERQRTRLRPWNQAVFDYTHVQEFANGAVMIDVELPIEEDGRLVDSAIIMTFEFRADGQVEFQGLSY